MLKSPVNMLNVVVFPAPDRRETKGGRYNARVVKYNRLSHNEIPYSVDCEVSATICTLFQVMRSNGFTLKSFVFCCD